MSVCFSLKNYQLTRRCEFEREVPQQALPRDISDCAEYDDGAREAGMAEAHTLVGGELGHALAPHQVLPVVLRTQEKNNQQCVFFKPVLLRRNNSVLDVLEISDLLS
jgi:hypothetical protein